MRFMAGVILGFLAAHGTLALALSGAKFRVEVPGEAAPMEPVMQVPDAGSVITVEAITVPKEEVKMRPLKTRKLVRDPTRKDLDALCNRE